MVCWARYTYIYRYVYIYIYIYLDILLDQPMIPFLGQTVKTVFEAGLFHTASASPSLFLSMIHFLVFKPYLAELAQCDFLPVVMFLGSQIPSGKVI